MNANNLPTEILMHIFKHLPGKDAWKCRRISRRWKDVVDSLMSEDMWKIYCETEHKDASAAAKANLPWRELYKSFTLWSKFGSADFSTYRSLGKFKTCQAFQILQNGVIAVCQCIRPTLYRDTLLSDLGFSDSVVYYSLKTMREMSRHSFDLYFTNYKENERLLCFINAEGELCVMLKATKQMFRVGDVLENDINLTGEYGLFETEVYFHNGQKEICVARLEDSNGQPVLRRHRLLKFCKKIIAFSHVSNGPVYILVDDISSKGSIYKYDSNDNDLTLVARTNNYSPNIINKLSQCYFDWTKLEILDWMLIKKAVNLLRLNVSSLGRSGNTVLLGTHTSTIKIYANPYTESGVLTLHSVDPTCIINMNGMYKSKFLQKIKQLQVVEIVNGHKLIVLVASKVFIFKILHRVESKQSRVRKRKLLDISEESRGTPSSGQKKKKSTFCIRPKYRYATRSTKRM